MFNRSIYSLTRHRPTAFILLAVLAALCGLGWWAVAGRVPVVEHSRGARLLCGPTADGPGDDVPRCRIEASFDPLAAERLRRGQPARFHAPDDPWASQDSVQAVVERVADRIEDGAVRVELVVTERQVNGSLRRHGLSGSVGVEVGQTSPLTLLRRAAGDARSPSPQSPAEARVER